jgi:hypothetical protein
MGRLIAGLTAWDVTLSSFEAVRAPTVTFQILNEGRILIGTVRGILVALWGQKFIALGLTST